jgi:hypothetical protein
MEVVVKVLSVNPKDAWKLEAELDLDEPVPFKPPKELGEGSLSQELEGCQIAQDLHDKITVVQEARVVACYENDGEGIVIIWRKQAWVVAS